MSNAMELAAAEVGAGAVSELLAAGYRRSVHRTRSRSVTKGFEIERNREAIPDKGTA